MNHQIVILQILKKKEKKINKNMTRKLHSVTPLAMQTKLSYFTTIKNLSQNVLTKSWHCQQKFNTYFKSIND
jgi:hypothetical protein